MLTDFEIAIHSTRTAHNTTWRSIRANNPGASFHTVTRIARPNTTREVVEVEAAAMQRLRQRRGYVVSAFVNEISK